MIREKPHQFYDTYSKNYKLYYLHQKRMLRKYNIYIDITTTHQETGIKSYNKESRKNTMNGAN
jgi:hypothetical protein